MNKKDIPYDIFHSSSISIWLAYLMSKRNHEKEKRRNSTSLNKILDEIVHDVILDVEREENNVLGEINEEYFKEPLYDDKEDDECTTILEL